MIGLQTMNPSVNDISFALNDHLAYATPYNES